MIMNAYDLLLVMMFWCFKPNVWRSFARIYAHRCQCSRRGLFRENAERLSSVDLVVDGW